MLTRLSFQTKVLLLPMIAAAAFMVLIAVNISIGASNRGYLDELQTTLYPGLHLSQRLETGLVAVQRGLQDAAVVNDRDRLDQVLASYNELMNTFSEAQHNPSLGDATRLRDDAERYWELAQRITRQLIENSNAEVDQRDLEMMQQRFAGLQTHLSEQTERVRKAMDAAFSAARDTSSLSTRVNLAIAIACLLGLSVLSLWIRQGVIGTLADVTNFVAAASAEILAVAKQTEANAQEEAAFITETQRAMDGLMSASTEIQSSAGRVLEQAQQSESASRTVAERIMKLDGQAQKITDISDTIRGIADKTDMLALNAALEGSKAGESGRGISLVGAEMRRLAETVTGAVRQIKELASEIRELSRLTVTATEVGQKLARETSEASREITLLLNQQRSATSQVTDSVVEIQQFAQQAKTGAEQARSTAADLVRSTAQLESLITGKELLAVRPAEASA